MLWPGLKISLRVKRIITRSRCVLGDHEDESSVPSCWLRAGSSVPSVLPALLHSPGGRFFVLQSKIV